MNVHAVGRTHLGLVRRRNEDAFHVGPSLVAVADGLGGHPAGDVASAIVIDALRVLDRPVLPADLCDALGRAIGAANAALQHRIGTEPELAGMATTLVAMAWSGTTAVVANVGDSRAYLLRSGRTFRISQDHTYGGLVHDAVGVPRLAGRLSRFLDGRAGGRSPDLTVRDLRPGDRFLLCSDGLSSYVPESLIHVALASADPAGETADRLVAPTLDHGGEDNVTVIVLDVG